MTHRYLCIHGHFYQPPRQDALTGIIPNESGTAPYHNWNEKIHRECYRPNAEQGNFNRISFNVGPTLMEWMASYDPPAHQLIIEQDRANFEHYGVGNAMAQPYNHTILPLANHHDKVTQIEWGLTDYQVRFGHKPTGMWLPETAVDIESLKLMVERGISYTILAPWQAATPNIDVSKPYRVMLGKRKSIVVFFYQMDISTRLSFDPMATSNADLFISNYISPQYKNGADANRDQILLFASDGELYGHHQQFRDRFLTRLVNGAASTHLIEVTFPGLYLQNHEVNDLVEINEDTSWSCHHGVERWKGDCDCTKGSTWKAPMRNALNDTAKVLDREYTRFAKRFTNDPAGMKNRFARVMLKQQTWDEFIHEETSVNLSTSEDNQFRMMMDAQIARQWMFTSCGWFFDEFNRIEPRNNVTYAAQAVYLTEKATGTPIYHRLIKPFGNIKSTRSALSGDYVFRSAYERAAKEV